jgi:tight adherence protein C
MATIIALLTALIVFCTYLLVDGYVLRKKRSAEAPVHLAPDGSAITTDDPDAVTNLHGDPSPAAAGILRLLRLLGVDVESAVHAVEQRFAHAGINSADAPVYYLFFTRIVTPLLLLVALFVVSGITAENKLLVVSAALIITVLALFGPRLYLQNLIDKRKKRLHRALPDTLDLLLICVESGLALDASLQRVCSELGRAYPEITAELNRTRLELTLLNDRTRALMNLGERTGMPAFRALISSLIQSERFGTSLSDTLRVLSEEFRLQRLADAEVKAARLPVMMTIPLIFLLMPAFFLIVLGPAIVRIVHDGQQITSK